MFTVVVRRPVRLMVVTSTSTRATVVVATWTGMTFCEQQPPPVSTSPDEISETPRRTPAPRCLASYGFPARRRPRSTATRARARGSRCRTEAAAGRIVVRQREIERTVVVEIDELPAVAIGPTANAEEFVERSVVVEVTPALGWPPAAEKQLRLDELETGPDGGRDRPEDGPVRRMPAQYAQKGPVPPGVL